MTRERLIRLALICQRQKNSEDLEIPKCCGFTEDKDRNTSGMFVTVLVDVHPIKLLDSLGELLPTDERPSLIT